MNRRDALKAGATLAALPSLAQAQAGSGKADADAWKPSVLSASQNETVVALIDLIIPATDTPGAKDANVNRYIDLMLRDGREGERVRFLNGLEWLDSYTKANKGNAFVKLSKPVQTETLKTLDAGQDDPALFEGFAFFRMVKSLTSRLYYNTQAGFTELNKGGRVPASYACGHANKPA
jgi:gluconate 2-dehydrogenase gamma chain